MDAEPEWLQTARERGLIVEERSSGSLSVVGIPTAGGPPRRRSARTAVATPDPPPAARWAIEFVVDYAPRNESNIGGTLGGKLARKREAKAAADAAIPGEVMALMPLPVLVTLTRVGGTKRMDSDGCSTSLKFVRDRVAAALGVDDGDTGRVRFRVRQRPGYGRSRVLVRVEPRSG